MADTWHEGLDARVTLPLVLILCCTDAELEEVDECEMVREWFSGNWWLDCFSVVI